MTIFKALFIGSVFIAFSSGAVFAEVNHAECEKKIHEAEQRAALAEQRAAEAEKRAVSIEKDATSMEKSLSTTPTPPAKQKNRLIDDSFIKF